MRKKGMVFNVCICLIFVMFATIGFCQSTVYQVSTFDRFEKGGYDGKISFSELKKRGQFGIGTVNGLDGEMIAVDGRFFRIAADAKVNPIEDSELTPFAMVAAYVDGIKTPVPLISGYGQLSDFLDKSLSDPEKAYVVRIDGQFARLKLRSVPRQHNPYRNLETVLKEQTVFELKNVKGTMVGFRFPSFVKGVNVPGYHFHMITDDRQAGGHVLDCEIESAEAKISFISDLNISFNAGD